MFYFLTEQIIQSEIIQQEFPTWKSKDFSQSEASDSDIMSWMEHSITTPS